MVFAVPGPVRNMRFADVLFSSVNVVWEPPADPNGVLTSSPIPSPGPCSREGDG